MRDEFSSHGSLLERLNARFAKGLVALWPDENKAWAWLSPLNPLPSTRPRNNFAGSSEEFLCCFARASGRF